MEDKEKLKTVNVDENTHKKLKITAAKKGVTIKELVKELTEEKADESK